MRTKCLEATRAIENERNKKESKDQTTGRSSTGTTGSRGTGGEGEKMFKLPTGPLPEKISLEYTPLQADNWKADMKLFLKTCTNMQVLSIEEQTTLVKRYVETSMWPLVELERGDEIVTMIQKIGDAYDRQVPKFARKVKFLDLMILKGESYVSWANRINQQAELADLKNIRAQDLQLMTFCKGLSETDRLYDKIVDMEIHSWSGAQEIIKKHTQSMALKADLVESAPRPQGQIMNQMSGSGVSKPRQASKSPGKPKDRGASRGREKTKSPNKGSNKSQERSQSGAHECWTCHEVVEGNHFGYNCPKGEKEGEEKRPITPHPRKDRSASGDKTKASQGNETYRRFRGYFGDPGPGPWKIIMRSPVQSTPATTDVGAAPAAVPAALRTMRDQGMKMGPRTRRRTGGTPGPSTS